MENSDGAENANSTGESRRNPVIRDEDVGLKAAVSRAATVRIKAYQKALRLLPLVERARREIEAERNKKLAGNYASDRAIANRVNEYCKEKDSPIFRPSRTSSWSGKTIRDTLIGAPEKIIESAVLECRTRMTELTLSADFTQSMDTVAELEREYIEYIAEALALKHRLNGNAVRSHPALLEEARQEAIRVAAAQRRAKEISMMARERHWKPNPPAVRKVFQS